MGTAELPHAGDRQRQHDPDRSGEISGQPSGGVLPLPDRSGRDLRELYPKLSYSGNRAILLDADQKLPEAELRSLRGLALTYHLRKRKYAFAAGAPRELELLRCGSRLIDRSAHFLGSTS